MAQVAKKNRLWQKQTLPWVGENPAKPTPCASKAPKLHSPVLLSTRPRSPRIGRHRSLPHNALTPRSPRKHATRSSPLSHRPLRVHLHVDAFERTTAEPAM